MLEVEPDATHDVIKRAYRRLARKWHPDVSDSPDAEAKFKELATAFEQVGDPVRRRAHDATVGRVSRGQLPQDFLDHAMSGIERAQDYTERVVVPHYAARWRGVGAEMTARLWHDLEDLADPTWLQGRAGWRARRRAARWLRAVHVTLETAPSHQLSRLALGRGDARIIVVTPWALHRAGFTDAADIDDALLRILLTRYAQVLSRRGFVPPTDPEDWPAVLASATATDRRAIAARWAQRAVYAGIAAVTALLLYAGFTGW